MREKHLLLRDNIGTFAKEDEAFNLLTMLSWLLPFLVVSFAILDLILAFVYLKWLHPWKIILQEVSSNSHLPLLIYWTQFQRSRKAGNPTTSRGRTIR